MVRPAQWHARSVQSRARAVDRDDLALDRLGRELGHELAHAAQELVVVVAHRGLGRALEHRRELAPRHRARRSEEDLAVRRALVALVLVEELLEELLAGPEARVDDLDLAAGLLAREPDHLLGEVADLDRLAHVEREDLAALPEHRGLHDELA